MSILLNSSVAQFLGSPIFMFIIIILIMYFMMIRPQRKRQKELEAFRNGLQPGQEVVTSGGIYGKVKSVDANIVNIEVAHGVVLRIDKSAVFANPVSAQQ
ncbi:MAG: preprotein translocase subunit YajC [Bacteroidaceae bacterium]|nr:preprotein translocase subunit YajC [Bacteroidaceae bacterium]